MTSWVMRSRQFGDGAVRNTERLEVLALIAGGSLAGTGLVYLPPAVAVAVLSTAGLLGNLALARSLCRWPEDPGAQRRFVRWTVAAFLVHLGLGLALSSSPRLISYVGGDAFTYHQGGAQLADSWSGLDIPPHLPVGKEGFFYLLGALYWAFGPHMAAGIAVNAALSAALVPLVGDTTRRLFGASAARRVPPLVVLLPGFLVWPSQLLREAAILLLLAAGANGAVRLTRAFQPRALVLVAVSLALLLTFRANVALVFGAGLLAGAAVARRRAIPAVATGAVVLGGLAVLVLGLGLGYSGYRLLGNVDLRQVNNIRQDSNTSATSGFLPAADISDARRAASFLPLGLVSFSLGPFPWQVRTPRQLLGVGETASLWILLPAFWRGLRRARGVAGRQSAVLLLPAFAVLGLLSLFVANYGTVVRERLQVVLLLLPFVALGLAGSAGTPSSPAGLAGEPAAGRRPPREHDQ